jgi:putative transcriptional regulator
MTNKSGSRKESVDDVFAGRTLGQLLVDGFKELSGDLKSGGNIAKKYKVYDIAPPQALPDFEPSEALAARTTLNASQAVFARFLGLSTNAVRTWEQGRGQPNKAVRIIFRFIQEDPTYWKAKFGNLMAIASPDHSAGITPNRKKSIVDAPQKRRKARQKKHKLVAGRSPARSLTK